MSNIDPIYDCFICSAKLHYSAILKCVVDSQGREHTCNPPTRPIEEFGLDSMRNERRAQQDFYGKFESTSQLKPLNEYKKASGRPSKERGHE